MSFRQAQMYTPNITKTNENGYSWYECDCCPYGYHIDLDFVRYCESISHEADRTGSIKRRKDRRRQRQSMEVLLGLLPPELTTLDQNYKPLHDQQLSKTVQKPQYTAKLPLIPDAFDDAVTDFERTLQRSKNKVCNNLPDVTAVSENIRRISSNSSMSSASSSSMTVHPSATEDQVNREYDPVAIESCALGPMALQNIREQMALSLERTKKLEDQVKLIPDLKDQLTTLKEENKRLVLRLKSEETKLNIQANNLKSPYYDSVKSHSTFMEVGHLYDSSKKEIPPSRKDFGVMCGVLTRHVGVGHQNPNTKSVSTTTINGYDSADKFEDKWMKEKVKLMNSQNVFNSLQSDKIRVTKGTQTILSREKKDVAIQSESQQVKNKITVNCNTQTVELKKIFNHMGILVKPQHSDFSMQKFVECYSVGCSDDTVDDVGCEKCNVLKRTVGIGPDSNEDSHTSPISLASLTVPRSKSFNLGDDRLNLSVRRRTVGSQYEPHNVTRACQYETTTHSKYCQHEPKVAEKNTQYERNSSSKNTDTKDLITPKKHVACEAKEYKSETKNVACNTFSAEIITCYKCLIKDEEHIKKDSNYSPTPSRIPRPQMPTTPVETRKFRRQDTYTKIYTSPTEKNSPIEARLSSLDLTPKNISLETYSLEAVNHNIKYPEVSTSFDQSDVNLLIQKRQIQESSLPVSETTAFQPNIQGSNRRKAVPSKEMQGALKVLNDTLQKSPSKNLKNHSAANIVQQEWFKISSLVTANPLDVEDYLDVFEDVSYVLLQYIVNMSDTSGNTAMHYAVSHGNFDVVSILLDSKVCDINKQNKAGYTSVMLVSLAEVRSQSDANVVRRLFQLADVNIRAREHGQTALMLAVSHGRLDMVRMLLEAGADINIQDEDGSTALMCAAEHGHIDIVKHFLNHPECDSTIIDVDGSTALKIAMEAGHRHIGVLLYAHERNHQKNHGAKIKKPKSPSPKTPSSPLPIRNSQRALIDIKSLK